MSYRVLSESEINQLEQQGCIADRWENVSVKEGFSLKNIRNVSFIGQNKLAFSEQIQATHQWGLYNCTLQNCIIEDQVLIRNCGIIANYIIRSHAQITNSNSIEAEPNSNFGLGSEAAVINEAGGREVTFYEQLNAPIAHLMAFMHHRPEFVKKLKRLIKERISKQKPDVGIIGHHAIIKNCNTITNVKIGDFAQIQGVSALNNGSIVSSKEASTTVSHGVIANHFIIGKGSSVTDGAILNNTFIGEGCLIERQFSAENTIVFANSQLFHGEACSAFCAPYTVSHHKSTLLIAAYFSFINIGSGSNQSNHMYKLGPVHQGVLERGCKLSSDSYLLWPGKIGPYTFVMGRHYSNPDLGNYPFSYLLETNGTSYLVPGANFRSIGTIRDAQKWPNRDIRKGEKSDPIQFKLLNPHLISKVLKAKNNLETIAEKQSPDSSEYHIGQVKLKKTALKRGISIYTEILILYYGDLLFNRYSSTNNNHETIITSIQKENTTFSGDWNDISGLIIPESETNEIIIQIENGEIEKLSQLEKAIKLHHSNFENMEWSWAIGMSEQSIGLNLNNLSSTNLANFLATYKTSLENSLNMLLRDAQKDYSETSKTGYGFNGEKDVKQADFIATRGSLKNNSFVIDLQNENNSKIKWIDSLR